jgi:hypothetical protein
MAILRFETPYDAVFIYKYGKGNTPLYKNQAELSAEIINDPNSGFESKKEITVRSAISQVFTGERNLSKSLNHALFSVIEKRFDKKKYNYPDFKKQLIERLSIAYKERIEEKRERVGDRDYDTLFEATQIGKEFLITTLEPAELHKSELANRLKNELLEKTGIVPQTNPDIIRAKYKFYLPNKERGRIAREFWDALKKHAESEYNIDQKEIDKRLKRANKDKIIQTFLAPQSIAMHPYVFINYEKQRDVRGFCVSYRNNEIPSVAELSLQVVYAWFEEYSKCFEEIEKNEWEIYST